VFDHLPDRIGSGRDVESLNSLLQMLGFKVWGQFLTTWFAPRCELGPQGWTLSFRGNVYPFVHPRGEHSLLFRRMEGRTENFTLGDNFTPRGQNSPLEDNFTPGGQSLPLGAKLRMGLWRVQWLRPVFNSDAT
jgi:hypothetical protein